MKASDWVVCQKKWDTWKASKTPLSNLVNQAIGPMAHFMLFKCIGGLDLFYDDAIVRTLCSRVLDFNQADENGNTYLQHVVWHTPSHYSESIAQLLLIGNAQVDACGPYSIRPLVSLLSSDGHDSKNLMRLLLHFDASPISRRELRYVDKTDYHFPRNYGFYRECAKRIGHCLLAKRAMALALKKRGVHKDMILLICQHIWNTRLTDEWVYSTPTKSGRINV